jgi:hypothetical protein
LPNRDTHSDCDADGNCYRNSESHCDCDRDRDCDGNCYRNSESHCDRDCDCYGNPHGGTNRGS